MNSCVFLKGAKLDFERRTPYCCSKIGFARFGSGAMSVCRNDEKTMTNRCPHPWKFNDKSMQRQCSEKLCKKHEKTPQMDPKREPKSKIIQEKTTSENRCEKGGACPDPPGGSAAWAGAPSKTNHLFSSRRRLVFVCLRLVFVSISPRRVSRRLFTSCDVLFSARVRLV